MKKEDASTRRARSGNWSARDARWPRSVTYLPAVRADLDVLLEAVLLRVFEPRLNGLMVPLPVFVGDGTTFPAGVDRIGIV